MVWIEKLREDSNKLTENSKFDLVCSLLTYAPPFLNQEELNIFLKSNKEELYNPLILLNYLEI